ncbi:MAG TPA: thiamine phosphate synthase [Thermoanaerobaculia bacterium]|nr:thiamine phosphate synthase [Thermoanaerobaculia bacterium]
MSRAPGPVALGAHRKAPLRVHWTRRESLRASAGPIYAIADADALAPTPVAEAVRRIAGAGVRWIQLRAKRVPDAELFRLAEGCVAAVEGTGAALWIDDRADLAALFPFAGLHLGQADLPPGAARKVVGEGPWIGLSTHDGAQLAAADDDPAVDVVAVGPVFPTRGKERPDPVVGLPFLAAARGRTAKTLVAIGGIDAGNVGRVLAAGADAAAVLSAVCRGDVAANCRRLLAAAEAADG